MRGSRVFLISCLCFIAGVFLGQALVKNRYLLAAFLFLDLVLICTLYLFKKMRGAAIGFCFLPLILGAFKYGLAIGKIERPGLEKYFNQELSFTGLVIGDPERGVSKAKARVKILELKTDVLITTRLFPSIEYGDELRVEGTLKEPPILEDFNYQDYLKRKGIYFLMSYPEIEILEKNKGHPVKQALLSFKNRLKAGLARAVPYSHLGLFEALIWGDEQNISFAWKEKLNITGTRHIAAVSGANITILSLMLLNLLLWLGFWRQRAFWLSLLLIFIYVLMIGAPACGVRAAIIAALLLFSQHCGRIADPERLVVIALAVMLFFNPLLIADIGFQLSFLAVLGLIYFGSFLMRLLKKVPEFLGLRMNLASTLSAQIFVLPILLYNFGRFSLVSPLANILILPAIPFLTISGLAVSLIGLFSRGLAQIISFPSQILLQLVLKIIDLFSLFPFASTQIEISALFVFLAYLFLGIVVYFLKKKQRRAFLNY